jgi:phosphate transport system substrate-binding protein
VSRARMARRAAGLIGAVVLISLALPVTPTLASDPVSGGGSTWSQVALEQWRGDVARQGLTINYQGVGSTTGRQQYSQGSFDFAVSEIPFQTKYCTNPADPSTCTDEVDATDLKSHPYTYMPIVAGGTSIMYHLSINGTLFTGLRLSPATLAGIFTGVITNWADPAIATDNPGQVLPHLSIIPVVRSDGSGTTAQFTAFMAAVTPAAWNKFCQSQSLSASPCPPTSQFPTPGSPFQAYQGSDGVANFVAAPYNNGSITYAETAYALQRGYPVASLLNTAGYYTQPTALNVAVALTKVSLNADKTQNLGAVYTNPDPRTYPMSSYSYMILPTSTNSPMNASKVQTLAQFVYYFLCTGQQKAIPLGYSPLPPNLVQIGFAAVGQMPGAPAAPALSQCANPTITGAFNLNSAPPPPPTAKKGVPGGGPHTGSTTASGGSGTAGTSGTSGTSGASANATHATNGQNSAVTTPAGLPGLTLGTDQGATDALAPAVQAQPQAFGHSWRTVSTWLAVFVVLLVAALAFGPPVFGGALDRRRSRAPRL